MSPILRVTLIASGAAIFLSLVSASQTYLLMLNHGHSFLRLFMWQLGCWGFWAIAAPAIVHISSRRRGFVRLAAVGVGLSVLHVLLAAALTFWLQPYMPVSR